MSKPKQTEAERLQEIGRNQAQCLQEMVAALENAPDDTAREEAEQRIHEDPLSLQVRSGWHAPGAARRRRARRGG